MGSPETCDKCGGVGRHVEGKRGFTRFPCPNATPTPPAPDDDKRKMGLYGKFRVERTDGKSAPGQKHDGCDYFVLDLTHDPLAPDALRAYAAGARRAGYGPLADDLDAKVGPAPADARPMVVGGAFVKFDRPAPADDAGWEPWGNPYPRHPDVIRTRDLCLAICEKHQAFDAAAEIRVMHLPPAPDAGAAEDHPSEAKRDHGAEGSDRAVVEAARALLDGTRRDGCLYCVCGRLMTGNVAHQANCAWNRLDAALRGTKGA